VKISAIVPLVLAALLRSTAALAQAPAPPILTELDEPPLVGEYNKLIFVRDRRDVIRLYPHAELVLQAQGSFGRQVKSLSPEQAMVDLGPRFFVRRSRFELGGELAKRLAFSAAIELRASRAIDGARADGRRTEVALDDAWGYVDAGRGLGLMLGLFQTPFSLENRTRVRDLSALERSVAVRGFAVPAPKVLGAAVTGRTYTGVGRLGWTAGAFGAEALEPGEPSRSFDVIGRFGVEPLATHLEHGDLRSLAFGVSGRVGTRNPRDGSSDFPAITTRQGFSLWRPTRKASSGETLRVLQTGTQGALGLDVRIPTRLLTLRTEGFYSLKDTRETGPLGAERGGTLRGLAGYAELSIWPLMAAGVLDTEQIELGTYPEPEHLELAPTVPHQDRYGVELVLSAGGISARYEPASRSGSEDPAAPAGDVRVLELSGGLNYWHTERFKVGTSYTLYITPSSGGGGNLAGVPGNLDLVDPGARRLHEVAARLTLSL
jgi:Phosphate-selective porin O and P